MNNQMILSGAILLIRLIIIILLTSSCTCSNSNFASAAKNNSENSTENSSELKEQILSVLQNLLAQSKEGNEKSKNEKPKKDSPTKLEVPNEILEKAYKELCQVFMAVEGNKTDWNFNSIAIYLRLLKIIIPNEPIEGLMDDIFNDIAKLLESSKKLEDIYRTAYIMMKIFYFLIVDERGLFAILRNYQGTLDQIEIMKMLTNITQLEKFVSDAESIEIRKAITAISRIQAKNIIEFQFKTMKFIKDCEVSTEKLLNQATDRTLRNLDSLNENVKAFINEYKSRIKSKSVADIEKQMFMQKIKELTMLVQEINEAVKVIREVALLRLNLSKQVIKITIPSKLNYITSRSN
ncbi:MAG: hypothetical protein LBF70_02135 [Holosporales bacterium]|jgi:hypothetical protein|nr:hypothetical protein [Holosporales bacterium]